MNELYTDPFIVPVNKPVGWTSYDVVRFIKKNFKIKKVGHGGTLDPFAEGLLLILLNSATRKMNTILKLPKRYLARIQLGVETDTLDPTGKVILRKDIPKFDEGQLLKILGAFTGEITQVPPLYSAKKVKGVRLYQYARRGEQVEIPARKVRIYELQLKSFTSDQLVIEALVSSGTYLRSLGRDIAHALGTCGYLLELKRTAIGKFSLENAYKIEELKQQWSPVLT